MAQDAKRRPLCILFVFIQALYPGQELPENLYFARSVGHASGVKHLCEGF
ncbi:hypothetical protein SAMN05444162_4055 [Paenibacillaceae bacterium GAS479]|nr:hypothetical protein SAMN05444162_4055 [Paenibacillaceae bacterium GAS479]